MMECRRCKAPSLRVTRQHCDGLYGNQNDRWRCPEPGMCHISAVCNACDVQWTERCPTHTAMTA